MLHQRGYRDVPGVDPFAQPGPFAQQGTIEDAEGKFDLIFFSDSLEHVPSPLDTLISASKLLAEQDRVVKVPLGDSQLGESTERSGSRSSRLATSPSPHATASESWPSERVCVS